VVAIHFQVSPGADLKVKKAMAGEKFEHVIEETYTGGDIARSLSIQFKG